MQAAGCSADGAVAAGRASGFASGSARVSAAAPRRAVRCCAAPARAEESMTDAYARIRASRAASKKKFERQEKLEKAGAFGKLFSGVVGGAPRAWRCTAARSRRAQPGPADARPAAAA